MLQKLVIGLEKSLAPVRMSYEFIHMALSEYVIFIEVAGKAVYIRALNKIGGGTWVV